MSRGYDINFPFRIKGIFTAYEFYWGKDNDFQGESHDFWEFVAVLSGQVEVVEDGRCYILEEGMMVCHAPGEFHRIKSAGGTEPHFLVLTFLHTGNIPDNLKTGVFSLDTDTLDEYKRIVYPLKELYDKSCDAVKNGIQAPGVSTKELAAVSALERFILILSEMDASEEKRSMAVSAREYRGLVRVMTECVRDNLTLAELAKRRHISESYVKKLFLTYAGEGFSRYYSRLQIGEIKRLLDGGESVSGAAEKMNFSSGAYLSAFFKKHTGITPSAYVSKK